VLVLSAVAVRAWGLDGQGMWYDEYATTKVVGRPFVAMLGAVAREEGAPPLYYLLLWPWQRLVGGGDLALRSFSVLAGAAVVPATYAIAHELRLGRRVPRIAAAIVAVNPMLVWYSQEARAYSLYVLR
jgi:uncharacterized membrane protein